MTKRKKPIERQQPARQPDDAERSAVEACELLGFGNNPSRLCASDRLKVDLVSTLRLVIDHAGQVALEGGTADIGRLVGAVEQLTKLLPKAATEPASSRVDPREIMLRTYLTMRERGALAGEGYDGKVARIAELEAEVERLTAALAEPTLAEPTPPPPPAGNVLTLSRGPSPPPASVPPSLKPPLRGPPEPWRAFYGDNSRWEV
jgi:hypothetical protein